MSEGKYDIEICSLSACKQLKLKLFASQYACTTGQWMVHVKQLIGRSSTDKQVIESGRQLNEKYCKLDLIRIQTTKVVIFFLASYLHSDKPGMDYKAEIIKLL